MDFRILGPLEVCAGARTVALGGDKQRALLAILLLHANQVVSADRLIDNLWGERPPPTALRTLQVYVSRLRKALDGSGDRSAGSSNGALVTRGHGYLIRVEPGELDLDRFRRLLEEGRDALGAGDAQGAAATLRTGLSLWRGPALADFAYEAFAQRAIAQLEELHLGALEERIEADLALGGHRTLVSELAPLVEQNPLRERLREQFMLALYRCGRQSEALESYQEYRRTLSAELGLDPGQGLAQLEVAILNRDASLAVHVDKGAATEPAVRAPASGRAALKRYRLRLALGGAVLIAVATTAAVLVSSRGDAALPSVIAANSVGAISPSHGALSAVVPVGSSPSGLAAGAGALWVSSYNAGTVSRIDDATHAVVQTIPAGSTPSGIAVGDGAVWVANFFGGTVSRIDPAAGRVVQQIAVGNGPSGVAVGDGAVWVTNSRDDTLSRVDAVSGAVVMTIALGGGATDVTYGFGAVWVSDASDGRVLRIDPRSAQVVQSINVGTGPAAIVAGDGSLWVANSLDGTVSRIDPRTNSVAATIPVDNGPNAIAVGAGGVWVASEFGGSVARIDPATDTVAFRIKVGNRPRGLVVAGGLVWVGAQASAASHRGGTLTVLQNAPFGSSDPAANIFSLATVETLYMTNDGLTAFKRVGGSDGEQVVPDLATSLPAPTDGGLTYSFQLRRGVRYSNGQPVRPEDFRRALERDFELGIPLTLGYYENLVGGAACLARPARCDLSHGIVIDDAANTVTFHLVTPDPEFLARLAVWTAVAVPTGTPNHDTGSHPLPATGPYEIASETPRQITLVRNPYFHEWSHAAQPDGYPDRIVWRIGASTEAAATAVERGAADYTLDPPPADRLGELQTRFASQLHVNPNDVSVVMGLNTRAAPFTDLRVRRALNYAIDRAKLASLLGQESQPSCQMLPPSIRGYSPYCPYTRDPNAAGVWSAPDLAKAQTLIAASGTRGTPITIWQDPAPYLTDFTAAGRYLVSLLDRLGYPTRIKTFAANDALSYYRFADSRTRAQAALGVYTPNYPAASEFLGPQLQSCQSFLPNTTNNPNLLEFCDPRFDATVRSALAAEAVRSPSAAQLWTKADRQFIDQAPVVSFVTPSTIDFVSHRVGDYQYDPQLGVLIDQLWVH